MLISIVNLGLEVKSLFVSLPLLVGSASVFAQGAFEGFYGQLGVGYQQTSPTNSINASINGVTVPSSLSSSSASITVTAATLGYTSNINTNFTLGIGVDYSPIASSGRQQVIKVSNQTPVISTTQQKSAYNLFISPGLTIGNDAVAYLKAGYTGMQAQAYKTINFSGYSLGIGYKQTIVDGLYGFGEVNYANYGNQNLYQSQVIANRSLNTTISSSVTLTSVLFGLGYKF
jgi:hypothetical protein